LISDLIEKLGFKVISIGEERYHLLLEEFLGILEFGLKIVKLGFQFYTFGEEIAVGEESCWER